MSQEMFLLGENWQSHSNVRTKMTVDNNFEGNLINITVRLNINEHSTSRNLFHREYFYLALSF